MTVSAVCRKGPVLTSYSAIIRFSSRSFSFSNAPTLSFVSSEISKMYNGSPSRSRRPVHAG